MQAPTQSTTPAPVAPQLDDEIQLDVELVAGLAGVPSLLDLLCAHTGMGFAAVARVTPTSWTACAVLDRIGFGLPAGGQLPVETTLCLESRAARAAIVIDHASRDATYRDHHTPRIYGIESYVSVPIILGNGDYFGNLCAIDPKPAKVSGADTVAMFSAYAALIARQLDMEHERRSATLALLDAQDTAELREQFIAVLGHDLRNPLAAISTIGKVMVKGSAGVDYPALGQRVLTSARRMSALIDDVLDFTRARLGSGLGVRMSVQQDLSASLRDVLDEIRRACPEYRFVDEIDVSGAVLCDTGRLQQLLSNLLGNAIQYGSAADPVVARATIDGGELVIAVTNGGDPIPPAVQRRIFEPYWRPPTTSTVAGLGLGLHICQQIAEAHGGTLSVASGDGRQTTFTARLPLRQS